MGTKPKQLNVQGRGEKIAVVVSRFNENITKRLLDGCLDELIKAGIQRNNVMIVWVPGSLEIPLIAKKFAKRKTIDAVICLGAVIRGETFHFELVAYGVTQGIVQAALMTEKPIIFGVLSTDTLEQARKRSDGQNNKGRDAAHAALEMTTLIRKLKI